MNTPAYPLLLLVMLVSAIRCNFGPPDPQRKDKHGIVHALNCPNAFPTRDYTGAKCQLDNCNNWIEDAEYHWYCMSCSEYTSPNEVEIPICPSHKKKPRWIMCFKKGALQVASQGGFQDCYQLFFGASSSLDYPRWMH
ncbi:hypothetical protein PCASD_18894 [Puccinia coronata f. sp. avenae]|uniref:Secreted protein n=1 Tax=Puccinia coronata f. sp. avenae TaxID=200324 RepID=A0A2N5TWR7_9BASI|nr:hypothetical protein PCASD_18894 [Puccinia coronata f. sp. avenae]